MNVKNLIRNGLTRTKNLSIRSMNWIAYTLCPLPRPLYNKRYNLVVCAIFKNEARFLKEWIEYHELIGVDHFYLYNNNSTDKYQEVLSEYIESGLVTLTEWPYEQGQISAYKHFYDTFWNESQWVSFIDIDEFYVPKKDSNLLDWIKRNDRYPVLLVYWKMFGSGGFLTHDENKLCIEQYVSSWESLVKCGKCLINTDFSISSFDATTHHATRVNYRRFKYYPKDVFGHVNVNDKESLISKKKLTEADIQINHYWSKGWDVYNQKRSWSGDVYFKNNPKGNIGYFLQHELRNTSIDLNIRRFLLILKWKMSKSPEFREFKESD